MDAKAVARRALERIKSLPKGIDYSAHCTWQGAVQRFFGCLNLRKNTLSCDYFRLRDLYYLSFTFDHKNMVINY